MSVPGCDYAPGKVRPTFFLVGSLKDYSLCWHRNILSAPMIILLLVLQIWDICCHGILLDGFVLFLRAFSSTTPSLTWSVITANILVLWTSWPCGIVAWRSCTRSTSSWTRLSLLTFSVTWRRQTAPTPTPSSTSGKK